jgi:hypothetical protein
MAEFIGTTDKHNVAETRLDPGSAETYCVSTGRTGVYDSLAGSAEIKLTGDDRRGITVEKPGNVDHVGFFTF